MEQQNCLGIYLAKDKATAVLLSGHGNTPSVLTDFTVTAEPVEAEQTEVGTEDGEEEQQPKVNLLSLVQKKLTELGLKFDSASISLDCAMFSQHDLRSDFTEYKQIANTIKFDAEEAVATDSTELAVAFDITGSDTTGTNVTVYSANRSSMFEVLRQGQTVGIDPLAIEPDTVCHSRFLHNDPSVKHSETTICAVISDHACYIICPAEPDNCPSVRSFLIRPGQDKTKILGTQLPLTIASLNSNEAITTIVVAGDTDGVDIDLLTERTALEVRKIDLKESVNATSSLPGSSTNTDFAAAYGAALAQCLKLGHTDFRQDFLPYQGTRKALERSLRFISICVCVVLIAAGISFQKQSMDVKEATAAVNSQLQQDYRDAMLGKTHSGPMPISSRLRLELSRIQKDGAGASMGDDNSIVAKLAYTLEAINNTPKNIGLEVNKISITEKLIQLDGLTKSNSSTLVLFKALDDHAKLKKLSEGSIPKGNTDAFNVTLEVAKKGQRR